MGVGACCVILLGCGKGSSPKAESPGPLATVETAPPPEPAPVEVSTSGAAAEAPPPEPTTAEPEPPKPEPLSDEQTLRLTSLANGAEIDQAKLAQTRAKDARVRKFAALMIDHHGKAMQKQAALATKLKLKEAESAEAAELATQAATTLAMLKAAPANEFDRVYMSSQVDAHKKVHELIVTQLLPNAQAPELKAYLEELRPTIESHLQEAEALHQQLLAEPVPVEEKPSTPPKK